MPSFSICVSSRISVLTPTSLASAVARLANSRGGSTLPGSFASSRARLLHSPRIRPRATAASMIALTLGEASTAATIHAGTAAGGGSSVL